MTVLTQFLLLWTRTPSDYDVLISRTMTEQWAACHLPVLTQNDQHTLYTGYHITQPDGQLVICPGCNGVENRKWVVRKEDVRVQCRLCDSECIVPKVVRDPTGLLGHYGLLKLRFPQEPMKVTWAFRNSQQQVQKEQMSNPPRQQLQAPSSMRALIPPSASRPTLPPPPSGEVLLRLPQEGDKITEEHDPMDVDPIPSTVTTPLSSLSPPPSPTPPDIPTLAALHASHPSPLDQATSGTKHSRLSAPPAQTQRSHSAPVAEGDRAPTSLADLPAIMVSTKSNKRRKRN